MAATEKGARTRQSIILVAADAFARSGYAGVGLNNVAERAGVTKGAFYFHFPSKESLAHAVCSSYHDQLNELRQRLAVDERDPMRRMVRLVFDVAGSYRSDPLARGTTRLLEESNRLDTPLKTLNPGWIRWLEVTLSEAAETGSLRADVDVASLAHLLNASFYGIQVLSYSRTAWMDLLRRTRDLFRYLLPAVLSDPAEVTALDELAGTLTLTSEQVRPTDAEVSAAQPA